MDFSSCSKTKALFLEVVKRQSSKIYPQVYLLLDDQSVKDCRVEIIMKDLDGVTSEVIVIEGQQEELKG